MSRLCDTGFYSKNIVWAEIHRKYDRHTFLWRILDWFIQFERPVKKP